MCRRNKKEERVLGTPLCTAISNSEPSHATASPVIKGCMRHGAPMGMCYFRNIRHALGRYIFWLAWPASGCLFAREGPRHAAMPQSSSGMSFFVVSNTTMLTLFLLLISKDFVGRICNNGNCEINPLLTSLVLSTRRKKLEPGLTICGDHKQALSHPDSFSLSLCFLSFLLNFASPANGRSLDNPCFSVNTLV